MFEVAGDFGFSLKPLPRPREFHHFGIHFLQCHVAFEFFVAGEPDRAECAGSQLALNGESGVEIAAVDASGTLRRQGRRTTGGIGRGTGGIRHQQRVADLTASQLFRTDGILQSQPSIVRQARSDIRIAVGRLLSNVGNRILNQSRQFREIAGV